MSDKAERKIYPLSKVSPEDTKVELSCMGTRFVLMYLEDLYGRKAVEEFVYDLEMNRDYLMDRTCWISYEFYFRFLQAVVDFTQNPNAPYEAGLRSTRLQCSGAVALLVARLGTVRSTYRLLPVMLPRWGKFAEWKIHLLTHNKCVISIKNYRYAQDRNNCLCIQGCLAAIPVYHGLPPAKVEHPHCICDGADACVYEVTWVSRPRGLWSICLGVLGSAVGAAYWLLFGHSLVYITPSLLFPIVGFAIGALLDYDIAFKKLHVHSETQASYLEESLRDIEKLNTDLQNKVEEHTKELSKANLDLKQALEDLETTQEKALLAEKQAAVGTLAAGMAHEMNSPINAAMLSVQSLQEDLGDKKSSYQEDINIMKNAMKRCHRIITDLLSYVRSPVLEVDLRIEDIVDKSLAVFEQEKPEGITITKEVTTDLPRLVLDRLQIERVILNLLKNASDAMEDNGVIHVSLAHESDSIVLKITDRGPGIEKKVLKRIFDPFFTTKKTGEGMGLGLAICHQLVERNGGTITASSQIKKGTTFAVRFPTTSSQK